jgi:hypothetical protein
MWGRRGGLEQAGDAATQGLDHQHGNGEPNRLGDVRARSRPGLAATSAFCGRPAPTVVDPSAIVDPAAHLDPSGVVIGPGCRIEAHAVVLGGSELGASVRVMPGAALGAEGFQAIRVGDALMDFRHAGRLSIGDRTVVMANAVLRPAPASGRRRRSAPTAASATAPSSRTTAGSARAA